MDNDNGTQHIKRVAVITAALFMIVAGAMTNGQQMYYMAAVLITLPIVAYVLGQLSLRGLEFERKAPDVAWEGETTTFEIAVTSRSRLPRIAVRVVDDLPKFITRQGGPDITFNLPALSEERVPYQVRLEKRGVYHLRGIRVIASDPLGLFSVSTVVSCPAELLVYPFPSPMPDIALSGAERYGVADLPFSSARGSGIDPDGIRQYHAGDPLRRVHWKSMARTGHLNVIEFEESRALSVVLVLDTSAAGDVGEGKQNAFEYLVNAAASLAQSATRHGASIRLISGDRPGPEAAPGRGTDHLFAILAGLARAEAATPTPLSASLADKIGLLPSGTSLVLFTADADPALGAPVSRYTVAGIPVTVLYADPLSFDPHRTRPTRDIQREYAASIIGAQARMVVLRHNREARPLPEPVTDVRLFS